MQFWQDFTPTARWVTGLGALLVVALLVFRQCNHAAPSMEVQRHRGIAPTAH